MTNAANDHKIMLVMVWTAMVSQLKREKKQEVTGKMRKKREIKEKIRENHTANIEPNKK